jgi:hypothetical protein
MDKEKLFTDLLALLEELSVTVKYDRGNFKGGLVRYREDSLYYVNRKADIDAKIQNIVNELKQIDFPRELLSDEIREAFPELVAKD